MNKYLIIEKSEVSLKHLEEQSQELQKRSKELQKRSKIYRKRFHRLIKKSQSHQSAIVPHQISNV